MVAGLVEQSVRSHRFTAESKLWALLRIRGPYVLHADSKLLRARALLVFQATLGACGKVEDVVCVFKKGKAVVRENDRWGILDRETLKVLWR